MITVTVFNKKEEIVGVQLEGHAEYGKKGKDIVCSAVSILYINLVNSLESFTDDEKEINGSEKINFQNVIMKNMPSKEAELLFQSFMLGMTTIEQKYGKKYIVILNQEV
ncbi:MAG: ribosomal-processing cysteine protease Prp [Lachnospiraceae bacterium]|nr:ribosomal-processing cysteine protease Prp [Lachnospiraceae bacterium]